jgi:hypothetical protein
MSFLKRFFNPTARLICLVFLFFAFTALPALADNCSLKDREPLPNCVKVEYVNGGAIIKNTCSHPVTIKVDIAGNSDQRKTVSAGGRTVISTNDRFKLMCCPRYNKCSNN